ncbi:MAG: Asp-tRNA(Asn)/Glu-tRNA(Gln) amidotransferase subunit GatC [Chloroflexota bacterium]|nr:Asp-tRNA(Asn)/Glu-tRNA(Gln) amidotransferase subunit GatC [Chloroflexota bacterium]
MSTLDRSVVEKVAGLARIELTDEEIERFTAQLSVVLDAVDRLRSVDTSAIPPTASVLPVDNVMREDVVRPSLPLEEVFRNAPGRDGDHFRVQTVLEQR